MSLSHLETIRSLLFAGTTAPAACDAVLPHLPGIKTVIFDVYGTLLSSGCCRHPALKDSSLEDLLRSTVREHKLTLPETPTSLEANLAALIQKEHQASIAHGVTHSEVEIRSIWSELLHHPVGHAIEDIALRYECLTNPVWPMPGVSQLITELKARSLSLGIISNAQFYTPLLFPALLHATLPDLGFTESLCLFSYQYGFAKPGDDLYQILKERLIALGHFPDQVLYIGNDAHKDVHPAAKAGFRTALFAGDENSLDLHPEKSGLLPPDAVVTHLTQIPRLLGKGLDQTN